MKIRIPAAIEALIDPKSSLLTHRWYTFLRLLLDRVEPDYSKYAVTVTSSTTIKNGMRYIAVLSGTVYLYLPASALRDGLISITNTGPGCTVTIVPVTGETIQGMTFIALNTRWSSVCLYPGTLGYSIIG